MPPLHRKTISIADKSKFKITYDFASTLTFNQLTVQIYSKWAGPCTVMKAIIFKIKGKVGSTLKGRTVEDSYLPVAGAGVHGGHHPVRHRLL